MNFGENGDNQGRVYRIFAGLQILAFEIHVGGLILEPLSKVSEISRAREF